MAVTEQEWREVKGNRFLVPGSCSPIDGMALEKWLHFSCLYILSLSLSRKAASSQSYDDSL
jgi:hypothetical protein